MLQKKQVTQKGFSFAETLLSAFVLSVGLITIVLLITRSTAHSIELRDATIASQLSQEGLELARNVRDTNLAAGGCVVGYLGWYGGRY